MALTSGTRLGSYEILSPIGKGGMGEVYRANDTRLDRTVAIKVVPEHLAKSPERKQRFEREAKAISRLNHPHICTLYDVGEQDGVDYLVMEYIEGETLAERLKKGALPLDKALEYGIQIADGLDTAHRAGIVHRDLKPGNVMLTTPGVKLLDFGLAKALAVDSGTNFSESPTMTSEGTRAGVVLGTPSYMSPEQARGEGVDPRADIWSFGCVVYEMLTGQAAFTKNTVSETLASVLTGEPDWAALAPTAPPALRIMLRRCMEKDVNRRLPHIGAARIELADATELKKRAPASTRWWRPLLAGVAVLAVVLGIVWLSKDRLGPSETNPSVSRASVDPSPGESWVIGPHDPDIAISPDGLQIAYIARRDAGIQLVVRRLDEFESKALGGFGGFIRQPFFSPEGEWIGFVAGNVIKKVAVDGSAAVTVCVLPRYLSGATWAPDGTIIFGTLNGGLFRVPSAGGEPEQLTNPAGSAHRWPTMLPGGDAVLFASVLGAGSDVRVRSLTSGEEKVVVEGATFPLYAGTGHLLYVAAGVLWGVAFDVERLEVVGDAVPVVDGVMIKGPSEDGLGAADIGIASNGTLLYRPSGAKESGEIRAPTLVWVDRDGTEESLNLEPREYGRLRLTGDGTQIAVEVDDADTGQSNVWVGRVDDGTPLSQLTFDPARDSYPVWTTDGQHVIFGSEREGGGVFWKRADGAGSVERLLRFDAYWRGPVFVTQDGTGLVYARIRRGTSTDTESTHRVLSLRDDRTDEALALHSHFNASISPDGRWVTYISEETGNFEVYVQPFPNPSGSKWRISPSGGRDPVWSRDGRELFYLRENTMLAVRVITEPSFATEPAVELFDGPYVDASGRYYDVAPDGRFLMIKPGWLSAGREAPLRIVFNWFEELKRLVPTDK